MSILPFAACSGPSVPAPRPHATAPSASPADGAERQVTAKSESALRAELAEGNDPVAAACELADRLWAEDRFEEAEHVVATALTRAPGSPALASLHVRLLFDLARFPAAVDAAQALCARAPSALAWHDLAECRRALGDLEGAATALRTLRAAHAAEAWTKARGELLGRLEEEVAAEVRAGHRLYRSAREALALVRGAESPTLRCEALATLALEGGTQATRGLELGLGDPEPAVRVHALGVYRQACPDLRTVVEFGLADGSPLVRGAAARMVPAAAARGLVRSLLDGLAAESDRYACEQLHQGLLRATGIEISALGLDLREATDRRKLVDAWKAAVQT